MQRNEQDSIIVVEDVLRPVAVVRIEVDDQHPLTAPSELAGSDCDIRQQAKSHRSGSSGVVSRRTYSAKRSLCSARVELIDDGQTGSSCEKGRIPRISRCDRVLVQPSSSSLHRAPNRLDMIRRVDSEYLLVRCRSNDDGDQSFGQPGAACAVHDRPQTFRALGVRWSGEVIEIRLMSSEQNRHC